ncbi:MAG: hypothetical protein HY540_06960, partial [Deltaproteobacteria bacterium]|nr:hypothetical protein [Deltaproteobacteria bacterium]
MKHFHRYCFLLLMLAICGCAGPDADLLYFPPPAERDVTAPKPSTGAAGKACTITYSSQLCVAIKGKNIEVGTKENDRVCAEVPPFPLHISEGTNVTLLGSEFPDIDFPAQGKLKIPITINGKGAGSGETNIAKGNIDPSGNVTLPNFSLFILVQGTPLAEVSNITLTTGTTEVLPDLPAQVGSAPDSSGAMRLVSGLVLGSLSSPAADELLKGASLTANFSGTINPTLDACGGGALG